MFKLVILKFVSDEIDNWFFVSVEIETIHTMRNEHNALFHTPTYSNIIFDYVYWHTTTCFCLRVDSDRIATTAKAFYTGCLGFRCTTKQLHLKLFKTLRYDFVFFSPLLLLFSFPAWGWACCGFVWTFLALVGLFWCVSIVVLGHIVCAIAHIHL